MREPLKSPDVGIADAPPARQLAEVAPHALCVTKGKIAAAAAVTTDLTVNAPATKHTSKKARAKAAAAAAAATATATVSSTRIDDPTFRAVASGHKGDSAAVKLTVLGNTATTRALASGQQRRQVGLKLRAENGCNLVYVMWRLDPKPKLEVSVKRNPGDKTAKECGADGYQKVKPAFARLDATLDDGTPHELRAEISGDNLTAWIDGRVAWLGTLPESARDLIGPAGIRSDNLAFELASFSVDAETTAVDAVATKCVDEEADADTASTSDR